MCVIHEPSLLKMQGTGHEVVVLHRECPGTKQMKQDRLALWVKNGDLYKKYKQEKCSHQHS